MVRSSHANVEVHCTAAAGSSTRLASEATPSSSSSDPDAPSLPAATAAASLGSSALSDISTSRWSGSTATFCCSGVRSPSSWATSSGVPTQVPSLPEPAGGASYPSRRRARSTPPMSTPSSSRITSTWPLRDWPSASHSASSGEKP